MIKNYAILEENSYYLYTNITEIIRIPVEIRINSQNVDGEGRFGLPEADRAATIYLGTRSSRVFALETYVRAAPRHRIRVIIPFNTTQPRNNVATAGGTRDSSRDRHRPCSDNE